VANYEYLYNEYLYNEYLYNEYLYNEYLYNEYLYNEYLYNEYLYNELVACENMFNCIVFLQWDLVRVRAFTVGFTVTRWQ
jgi:hypothetical protein